MTKHGCNGRDKTKKNCKRRTALERPAERTRGRGGGGEGEWAGGGGGGGIVGYKYS